MLTCAIIDDDEIARLTLERFIEDSSDLHLLASLPGPIEALAFLKSGQRVDVLFLDVQMPLLSGLELLRLLPTPPKVVLTTSRPDFAVEAFELQVSDYLVKPFDFERFRQAVDRVTGQISAAAVASVPPESSVPPAAMFIKSSTRHVRVPLAEILYVEAVSNYAVVVTRGHQVVSNQSFKELADRLPAGNFERVHRSYIINRDHIEAVEDKMIHFVGGRAVPIGKTYLSDFMASLKA